MVTSAPLLGLLGTVAGMIQTFAALSNSGDVSTISVGISKALLTTQLGFAYRFTGLVLRWHILKGDLIALALS